MLPGHAGKLRKTHTQILSHFPVPILQVKIVTANKTFSKKMGLGCTHDIVIPVGIKIKYYKKLL